MKKTFTILIAALMLLTMINLPNTAMGQASVGTTMWAETWTGATTATSGNNNATPSANYGNGTTVYNNGTVTYTQSANTVYVYTNGSLAGGTAPELLLSSGKTWTISNIPTGGATELTLTYKSNNTKSSVTCSTAGATISGSSKSYTITPNGAATITLVFSSTSNTRIDDVSLTVKTAGSSDEATSVVINHSEVKNNIYGDNTNGGSFSAKVFDSSDEEIDGAAVSWSSSNTSVATINPSTGVVTLVAVGNTTITASYAGSSGFYQSSFATYPLTVVNENPNLTTIWSEDFSSYSANAVPAGGTYSYACTDGGGTTKIYNEASTGGVAPELLVAKTNGTFSAIIPLLTPTYAYSGELTLTYKTNAQSLNVKTTTNGLTVDGEESVGAGLTFSTKETHTITFKGVTTSTENITIVFTATSGSNVRLDDIVLKGEQAALTKVATPVISPASGVVVSGTEVTITCATDGATIKYSYDNMTWNDYSSALTITENKTVYAKGIKGGLTESDVATATYTIAMPCATPTFSVAAGEVDPGTTVTISTTTDGATIYYTTNGSDPTTSSTIYSSAITINAAMTLKAMAVKDGMANSTVASAAYTVRDYATLPFNWAGGGKSNFEDLIGISTSGLGSDYTSSNYGVYQMKFDGTGDYIQIKTDSQPGVVTIGALLNGNTASTIKVQASANGTTFDEGEVLTVSGSQYDISNLITTRTFASDVRYIRLYFTKSGANVGVGPIKIAKQISGEVSYESLTISSDDTYIVANGGVLTVTGTLTNNGTAANLIIEDGGQLIVSNTGVQATFQKSVTGCGSATDNANNYKLIAKPTTGNMTLTAGEGMLANNYDLYYFDENENGAEWRNYKVSPFTINNGQGYLYANSEDVILNFAGEVPTAKTTTESGISLSYTSGNHFAGFNLIGNPFAVNITSMKINTTPCGYYKLENDGTFTSVPNVALNPVAVGQGFMVETLADSDKLHLNPSAKDEESFSNETIRLEVANGEYTDVAYICFGNMMPLTKINHMNEEAPMIYIHNEKSDKAVAVYNNRGEVKSFNVNFVAKTTGRYTISGKMMNGEVKYMHLYDRLTGIDTDLLTDSYTFIGAKGDNAGRFILNLESVDNGSSTGSETFAWQSGSEIIVDGEGTLEVYDVTGRKVMNAVVNGAHKVSGLNNGLYIFKLNGKTQKIIVR